MLLLGCDAQKQTKKKICLSVYPSSTHICCFLRYTFPSLVISWCILTGLSQELGSHFTYFSLLEGQQRAKIVTDFCFKRPHIMKNTFSLVSTYIGPASSQNEDDKRFLHGLCSPPTGNRALLQAVQIQLLTLCNERSHYHRPASSVWW